eukprot:GHVR01159353.1.p1 GENE.GHVR01159353.1~~GHVR01159353.1.p1  ORF type:complete len:275 (+),score=54.07 GHVR01159353.1:1340-2164(+)
MSYIASILLIHLDEYSSFVCLCSLLGGCTVLNGLYEMKYNRVKYRYDLFDALLHYTNINLYNHMKNIGIPSELYLLEWMLTLYTKPLSMKYAALIWDIFLLEGEWVIVGAAVALVCLANNALIQCNDVGQVREILLNISSFVTSEEELLLSIRKTKPSEGIILKLSRLGSLSGFEQLTCHVSRLNSCETVSIRQWNDIIYNNCIDNDNNNNNAKNINNNINTRNKNKTININKRRYYRGNEGWGRRKLNKYPGCIPRHNEYNQYVSSSNTSDYD